MTPICIGIILKILVLNSIQIRLLLTVSSQLVTCTT